MTAQIEVFVVVNSQGQYEAGATEEEALDRFEQQIGGTDHRRVYQMHLTVPLAKIIHVTAALPERRGGSYSLEIRS